MRNKHIDVSMAQIDVPTSHVIVPQVPRNPEPTLYDYLALLLAFVVPIVPHLINKSGSGNK